MKPELNGRGGDREAVDCTKASARDNDKRAVRFKVHRMEAD